ncbi:hypothetical protein D3C87_1099610 [compost metagenome]
MPGNPVAQVGQGGDLVEALLDVVFPESGLPGLESRPHNGRRDGLGDGQQGDPGRVPAGLLCSRRDVI